MSTGNTGDADPTTNGSDDSRPMLRIVSGNPTDEDIAALVAVLTAAGGGPAPHHDAGPRDDWGRIEDNLRSAWPASTGFLRGRW
ncbi:MULTISPECIES: acyl-CoA carboxylase epsilon subunit [unclassified Gordonia (in: high G+C Gram-positive bacteria)]